MERITKLLLAMSLLLAITTVANAGMYDDNIVYRADGNWFLSENPGPYLPGTATVTSQTGWGGSAGDVPMVGDVNGDGQDDIVINRVLGANYQWLSGHTTSAAGAAVIGSQAFPGPDSSVVLGAVAGSSGNFLADIDGDGSDDALTVYNGYQWGAFTSSTTAGLGGGAWQGFNQFGLAGDQPIVGDFNGDGRDDIGVYRQAGGGVYWKDSAGAWGTGAVNLTGQIGGGATDSLLIGNLNGDAFDDAVMVRQTGAGLIQWFGLINDGTGKLDYFNPGTTIVNFGLDGVDVPFLADINGDGMDDIGIHRAGAHYTTYTTAGGALGVNPAGDTNWNFGLPTDTQLFGQFSIPEPATLSLLGFGGLMLIKRRRA